MMQPLWAKGKAAELPAYVRRFTWGEKLFRPGDRLLVAVSGGPDSVALLHLLQGLREEWKLGLGVAHFEHGLRGEASREDARFVAALARDLGLPLYPGRGDVRSWSRSRKISLQMAARELRLGFLEETRRSQAYDLIALGHTADDQVELFFLRLLRGAGPEGLKGMWPRTPGGLVRPLVAVGKEVLLAWLKQENLPYREDLSNLNRRYLRNRVRLDLLPGLLRDYNPRLKSAVWRLMALLQEDEALLGEAAARAWDQVGRRLTPDLVALAIPPFLDLAPGLQKRLLRLTLGPFRSGEEMTSAQVAGLLALARGRRSGGSLTWGDCRVARAGSELHVCRPLPPPPPGWLAVLPGEGEVEAPGGWRLQARLLSAAPSPPQPFPPHLAWLDREKVAFPLTLRPWQAGDRFWPEGGPGMKKIQDFFVDAKIPRWLRLHLPLVASGGRIIWVPGLRLAGPVKLTSASRSILALEVTPRTPEASRVWEYLLALLPPTVGIG